MKRPEIDRRLAAGEPVAQLARAYELNLSSQQRHRKNCLKLASSNAIKKDACPYRKSNPHVLMVESTEDRSQLDTPVALNGPSIRRILP
ncbi:MAG: hypothetical protein P8Y71_26350 [Pseudolabrys sp.]